MVREAVLVLVIGSGIWVAMSAVSVWQAWWIVAVFAAAGLDLFPAP